MKKNSKLFLKIILVYTFFTSAPLFAQQIIFEEGLAAFEKTLYPKLRQNCLACHGDNGPQVGHSVSDIRAAYLESKYYTDFSNPLNSLFYAQVKKKHWLKVDPQASGMTETEMLNALNDWWQAGENNINSTYALITQSMQLPASLPLYSAGNWLNIKWDLGQTNNLYNGCVFTLDIQKVSDNQPNLLTGSYRVRRPALSCSLKSFKFKGVLIAVSESVASFENIYANSDAQIFNNSTLTLLNQEVMILLQRNLISNDNLRIIFQEITPL